MKWVLSVVIIAAMMAGVVAFGLFQQYGDFGSIPPYETIAAQLKAQHPRNPDSLMILSLYIAIALILPAFLIAAMMAFRAKDEYGSARWASERDIKKFGLRAKSGVILAKRGGFIRSDKPLSTLCVAPPGTGKTAAVVIPNILAWHGSIVALDIKGEISQKTERFRARFGKTLIFDPASKTNEVGFNPLAKEMLPIDWNEIEQQVYQVTELAFQSRKSDAGSDHWIPEAKNMFMFFATYLINRDGETSVPAVRNFAMDAPNLQEAVGSIVGEEGESLPTLTRQLGNALTQKAPKEFSGIFSTFQTKLSVFGDAFVQKSFASNTIAPETLRAERVTLYFKVAEIDAERLSPCVRLFLDFVAKRLMQREKREDDLPVLFMLDEFPRFGRIPVLLKMPALGRSYGLLAMFFFQSNGQVAEIYEKSGLEELEATTAYKLLLTQNEFNTAKAYSESIGQFTRVKKGKGSSMNDDLKQSSSTNQSVEGAALIRPEDLMSMPSDEIIVLAQNHRKNPIKATPAYWFKDKEMKRAVEEGR